MSAPPVLPGRAAAATACLLLVGGPAAAQSQKPVHIIVPYAPAGTPAEVVARVNRIVVEAFSRGNMRARLTALGAEPGTQTSAQFAAFLEPEAQKWAKVVKAAGIKAD